MTSSNSIKFGRRVCESVGVLHVTDTAHDLNSCFVSDRLLHSLSFFSQFKSRNSTHHLSMLVTKELIQDSVGSSFH